jgi:hypothetical protein
LSEFAFELDLDLDEVEVVHNHPES